MDVYIKLIDGEPCLPPQNKDDILNYNMDIELLIEDGYKRLINADIPETIRMYHFEYHEMEDTIEEAIVYDETQEEAEARIAKNNRNHIDSLTCTKRVFALILKQLGISYSMLRELIDSNEDARLEWDLCIELLRGNPLLNVMGEQLGITPEKLDKIFLYANGEITENELAEN